MSSDIIQDSNNGIDSRQINSMIDSVSKIRMDMNKKINQIESSSHKITTITNKNINKINIDLNNVKKNIYKQNSSIKSIANQKGIQEYQKTVINAKESNVCSF